MERSKTVFSLFLLLSFVNCLTINAQISTDTLAAYQYYKVADSLYTISNYELSIQNYEKALTLYQKARAWERVASCYNKLSKNHRINYNCDLALTFAKKAINLSTTHLPKNHPEKTNTFDNLGLYHEFCSFDYNAALDYYQKALALREQIFPNEHPDIALSYVNLGIISRLLKSYDQALYYLEKALQIRIKTLGKNHLKVAYSYSWIGSNYWEIGKLDMAMEYYQKAIAITTKIIDKNHTHNSVPYHNMGLIHAERGNYDKALEYYKKALFIKIKTYGSNHPRVALTYNGIGIIYNTKGNYDTALKYYKKALNIQLNTLGENSPGAANYYNNIGFSYKYKGNYDKALNHYKKAILIRGKLFGENSIQAANTFDNIGEAYILRKSYDTAIYYLNKGFEIRRKKLDANHSAIGDSYLSLGKLYQKKEAYNKAIDCYNKALSVFTLSYGLKNPRIVDTHNNIASSYSDLRDYQKALIYYENAIVANTKPNQEPSKLNTFDPSQFLNNKYLLATLLGQSKVLKQLYNENNDIQYLEKSNAAYQKADMLIDFIRASTQNHQDKIRFAKQAKELYTGAIQTQLLLYNINQKQHFLEKAFYYVEKSKANILKELLHDNNAKSFAGLSPKLLELEQELKIDHAYYQSRISELQSAKTVDSTQITDFESTLFDINRRQDSLTEVLEKNYPKYYALKHQNNIISVASIQEKLNENSTLLEFFTADSITYAFSISKNKLAVKELATPDLENKITKLQEAITSKNTASYKNTAHQLYQELIAPIADQLVGDQLIIVPDGSLWHLNFDLLLTQKDVSNNPAALSYLLKDYAITYANSANLFFDTYKSNPNTSKKRQECLAFSFSDSTNIIDAKTMSLATLRATGDDLPGTRKEIKAIADIIEGQYFFGSEAVEANFKKNAGGYNILHLALHGEVDNERPENSKLFFTKTKDTIEDNYLYAHELFAMDIPAELTVLSACNTGAGKIAKGEGIMSLGNAFQYAGTKSLLLSGWEVSDQTTPELMKLFYTNLKAGMNKAKALQQAKLSYLHTADARHTAPFYWGGFYLVGDSSPMEFASTSYWFWIVGLGVLGMLFLSLFLYRRKTKNKN